MSYFGHTCTLPFMERPMGPCPACEYVREMHGIGMAAASLREIVRASLPLPAIPPALAPREWADVLRSGGPMGYDSVLADSDGRPETMAYLIAIANAALPNEDPRKITREIVERLQSTRGEYLDFSAFGHALASYLPPESDRAPLRCVSCGHTEAEHCVTSTLIVCTVEGCGCDLADTEPEPFRHAANNDASRVDSVPAVDPSRSTPNTNLP